MNNNLREMLPDFRTEESKDGEVFYFGEIHPTTKQ